MRAILEIASNHRFTRFRAPTPVKGTNFAEQSGTSRRTPAGSFSIKVSVSSSCEGPKGIISLPPSRSAASKVGGTAFAPAAMTMASNWFGEN
jgi:hypothetical protein